jgi:hypothetical protein
MMSEFVTYARLGFAHIASAGAADHILFLLVLAAIYRWRDWKSALWVVSAFTVGHSITLALSVLNLLTLPPSVVEFLIPVTIVATGVENIVSRVRTEAGRYSRQRALFAAMFGLVHGAGFAGYLRSLFVDDITLPLFGFNVGIELGQLAVLSLIVLTLAAVDRALSAVTARAFVLRLTAVSAVTAAVAAVWAWQRLPGGA